jgi:hypothetical protein
LPRRSSALGDRCALFAHGTLLFDGLRDLNRGNEVRVPLRAGDAPAARSRRSHRISAATADVCPLQGNVDIAVGDVGEMPIVGN